MSGIKAWLRGLFNEKSEAPDTPLAEPDSRQEGPRTFAQDDNDFSVALYQKLASTPGNLVFSPFSIRIAMGMVSAGASGETAAQMTKVLRLASAPETTHERLGKIIKRLNAAGGKYEMAIANALWRQVGGSLRPEFLELIDRHYGGGISALDFQRDADAAREAINHWVENKTKEKIRDLIPPGALDRDTRLVVANALYFKGMWLEPFPKENTRDEPFYLANGHTVRSPFMRDCQYAGYAQLAGFQAVDLYYLGDDLSMLVVLPDMKDGLRDLEPRLSEKLLGECIAKMQKRDVAIVLPKFTMTSSALQLAAQLSALGMPLPFNRDKADFSGINGYAPPHDEAIVISHLFHRAFVEVNEEGTEAAAATAAVMCLAAGMPAPIPEFRADHPFLFAIRDRKSGAILFLGRVTDPTQDR